LEGIRHGITVGPRCNNPAFLPRNGSMSWLDGRSLPLRTLAVVSQRWRRQAPYPRCQWQPSLSELAKRPTHASHWCNTPNMCSIVGVEQK
jgi:hypothetical protein